MTMTGDSAPRPLSKVEYVRQRLREEIANGAIPPGAALRQVEIAERFGVSATPVREALRLLERDGSIEYAQHRGATVAEMSPVAIHDLYRLRARAEGLAVELAVERLRPGQLDLIVERHDALAETGGKGDAVELSRMNKAFHFSIYGSGSPVVSNYLTQIWTALPASKTIWQLEHQARVLLAEHAEILEAIKAGDAAGAGQRMAAHVMTSEMFRQAQAKS